MNFFELNWAVFSFSFIALDLSESVELSSKHFCFLYNKKNFILLVKFIFDLPESNGQDVKQANRCSVLIYHLLWLLNIWNVWKNCVPTCVFITHNERASPFRLNRAKTSDLSRNIIFISSNLTVFGLSSNIIKLSIWNTVQFLLPKIMFRGKSDISTQFWRNQSALLLCVYCVLLVYDTILINFAYQKNLIFNKTSNHKNNVFISRVSCC